MMKLARFVAFYGSWILSVYSPQTRQPVLLSFAGLIPLLVLFFYKLKNPLPVARTVFLFAMIGLGLDSALQGWGVYWFPTGSDLPWPLVPLWYWPLWIGFALSMIDLEPVLRHKFWMWPCLGAIGGPASYAAGEKMGAIVVTKSYWWVAGIWFVLVPLLALVIQREAKK